MCAVLIAELRRTRTALSNAERERGEDDSQFKTAFYQAARRAGKTEIFLNGEWKDNPGAIKKPDDTSDAVKYALHGIREMPITEFRKQLAGSYRDYFNKLDMGYKKPAPPIEEEEDDIYEAVLKKREADGWYDPWYKKIRVRYTRQSTPLYLYPVLTYSPYIKALGLYFWRHCWQISWNKFI